MSDVNVGETLARIDERTLHQGQQINDFRCEYREAINDLKRQLTPREECKPVCQAKFSECAKETEMQLLKEQVHDLTRLAWSTLVIVITILAKIAWDLFLKHI